MVAALFCCVLIMMHASALVDAHISASMVVEASGTRCLYQDLERDALAKGVYQVGHHTQFAAGESSHTGVTIFASGPDGDTLFRKENAADGKFAFTAPGEGAYACCFENKALVERTVSLSFTSGVGAKDLSEVARKEHLKPLAVELRRLEEILDEIKDEVMGLKAREALMRDINDTTNSRVRFFSLLSVFVVMTVGLWQVVHLKKYFERKKLI